MYLLWEISYVFMQIVLIVLCLQHGRHENPLYRLITRSSGRQLENLVAVMLLTGYKYGRAG